jgi:hypothetical protein
MSTSHQADAARQAGYRDPPGLPAAGTSPWATGLALFAGTIMIIGGVFQAIAGLVALFQNELRDEQEVGDHAQRDEAVLPRLVAADHRVGRLRDLGSLLVRPRNSPTLTRIHERHSASSECVPR